MQTKSTTKSDKRSIFDLPRISVNPFLLLPCAKPPEKTTRQGSLQKNAKIMMTERLKKVKELTSVAAKSS